jgi:hypothetical protein
MPNNQKLWILTEERPKEEVLEIILQTLCKTQGFNFKINKLKIIPIFIYGTFTHTYRLEGLEVQNIEETLIKIVSGKSSFVDYMVYLGSKNPPSPLDTPLVLIEETKTSDKESRNTGIFQRASKFVFCSALYPNVPRIMLFNHHNTVKVKAENYTSTHIFGIKILKTIGVDILGEDTDGIDKFSSIDELIHAKNSMKKPPKGNTPINITKTSDTIFISGRLFKSGTLSHDPNIGQLTSIAFSLRKLGWKDKIIITHHGLNQNHLRSTKPNKFTSIAEKVNIGLESLIMPSFENTKVDYWIYEENSEKLSTILLHILANNIETLKAIYENHAGCERGYLYDKNSLPLTIAKYIDGTKTNGNINIPDLVIRDEKRQEIFLLEGKISAKYKEALRSISNYGAFEKLVENLYPNYIIKRGIVLYGQIIDGEFVLFILNREGQVTIYRSKAGFIQEIDLLIKKINEINTP